MKKVGAYKTSDGKKFVEEENIKEAIKKGAVYIFGAPRHGKVRCYFCNGRRIDLTVEEYEVYRKVTNLTTREKLRRLAEYMKRRGAR